MKLMEKKSVVKAAHYRKLKLSHFGNQVGGSQCSLAANEEELVVQNRLQNRFVEAETKHVSATQSQYKDFPKRQ